MKLLRYQKVPSKKTRTKTSIRYAKENDREKRERKKGRRRDIEREGEIREIERERERERERDERDRESERARKILLKYPKPRNEAQRKVDYKNYDAITIRRNNNTKLSATRNYEEKL